MNNSYSHLGYQQYLQGNEEEACRLYMLALGEEPESSEVYTLIGHLFYTHNEKPTAISAYSRAIELDTSNAFALYYIALCYYHTGNNAEAVCYLDKLLNIKPSSELRLTRAIYSLPAIPAQSESLAELDAALEEWQYNTTPAIWAIPTLFSLSYRYGDHTERFRKLGRGYHSFNSCPPITPPIRKRKRLAIVVCSLSGSVWQVILEGMMINIDRSLFELVVIVIGHERDSLTRSARELADISFSDFLSIEDGEYLIRELEPDIIFYPEVGSQPETVIMSCRRLAPLQVASWGHPQTTGGSQIDIFFSGELIEPENGPEHYTERLVKLPGTGAIMPTPEPVESRKLGIKPGVVRFLIAQKEWKFHPEDDELYIRIAKLVGVCEFWIPLGASCGLLEKRITKSFVDAGLDPDVYLAFFPWQDAAGFNGLLDELDVYLDSPSFSGYTTAFKAIQRGIPIVTLEGKFMRQRLAAGLLRQVDMDMLIADSRERYVANAVELAQDPQLRDIIRCGLKQNKHKACNNMAVIRAFEQELLR